jgi:phosphoglycolate phosphatase-like HAD superfamily hydrolase
MSELPPGVELLNPHLYRGAFSAVLFDFDGTLSLLREGWPEIMAAMMLEVLRATPGGMADPGLPATVAGFVTGLNGRATIQQMEALAEEVVRRQGQPATASVYKQQYLERLDRVVAERKAAIATGTATADAWLVPGTRRLLNELDGRGLPFTLATGTDLPQVLEELSLLELAGHFGDRVHGPQHDADGFTKRAVIERQRSRHPDHPLLGIGDGKVETAEIKRVGGVAVGVAFDPDRPGRPSPWRREQLVAAGADLIITDYHQAPALVAWLFASA